ncbi:DUF3426 domain-containing protein [Vandammella animalimorsus]|uniref:zinc-ribbon and DUF3426 domain-containing protein n=1 Tax=Vandammella animalimorsus TaxID=2029117 RepID=UPI00325C0B49
MPSVTRCPSCETRFKVSADQLHASQGWVRCGRCHHIFDATQHLVAEQDGAQASPGPSDLTPTSQSQQPQGSSQLLLGSESELAGPAANQANAALPASTAAQAPATVPDEQHDEAKASFSNNPPADDLATPALTDKPPLAESGHFTAHSTERPIEERPTERWLKELSETFSPSSPVDTPPAADVGAGADAEKPAPQAPASEAATPSALAEPLAEAPAEQPFAEQPFAEQQLDATDVELIEAVALADLPDAAFDNSPLSAEQPAPQNANAPAPAPAAADDDNSHIDAFQKELERWQAMQAAAQSQDAPGSPATPEPADDAPSAAAANDVPADAIVLAPAVLVDKTPEPEPAASPSAAASARGSRPPATTGKSASRKQPSKTKAVSPPPANLRKKSQEPADSAAAPASQPASGQPSSLPGSTDPAPKKGAARREKRLTDLDDALRADADESLREVYRTAFSETQELNFVRQAARQAFWSHPGVKAGLGVLAAVLALLLALQVVLQQRDRIAATSPAMKSRMQSLCELLGCTVAPLRAIEQLVLDGSTFQAEGDDVFTLSWTVRNPSQLWLQTPHLWLSLRDHGGNTLIRRPLSPADMADAPMEIAPGQSWQGRQTLRLSQYAQAVTDYQLQIFYPASP